MNTVGSYDLINKLQLVSTKYTNYKLKNNDKEVEDNRRLKSLLNFHQSRIDEIKEKCDFIYKETKNETKERSNEDKYNIIIGLNNLASHKYKALKDTKFESTTVEVITLSTIDELIIINDSIKKLDYLKDKDSYINAYEQVLINSFATFLALKEMNLNESVTNTLSQGIFNQLKTLALL